MNGKAKLVISRVIDRILPERDITNGQIEEILPVRLFKAGDSDVSLGIKLLCDSARQIVQFHTVQTAVSHTFWEHTEEIADTHRRFYVPTDFDTIEKAFSGVKTAEKGIKQGLSRSITDSESPFSLYSVVDFCRSKVRRHRGV